MNFIEIMSGINVFPLLKQLEGYNGWNADDSWTKNKEQSAVYSTENIVLRYNKSSGPYLNDWSRPAFSVLSAAIPIIFDLMRAIPGEHLGKVMISRMKPGEKIDWHIDRMPQGIPLYYQRYQIPLQVAPGVHFIVGDEDLYMRPGTAWWFDNQQMHTVVNESDTDRISMFADIRPFAEYFDA